MTVILILLTVLSALASVFAFKAYDTALDVGIILTIIGDKILKEELTDGFEIREKDR